MNPIQRSQLATNRPFASGRPAHEPAHGPSTGPDGFGSVHAVKGRSAAAVNWPAKAAARADREAREAAAPLPARPVPGPLTRLEQAHSARHCTERDAEWIWWLDRVRYARADQLAHRFDVNLKTVRDRLTVLKDRGLVVPYQPRWKRPADRHGPARMVNDGPVVWQPTEFARELVGTGCGAPAPFVPLRTEHTLLLAEAVSVWERTGLTVLTEAEIRRAGDAWLGTRGHRPDGVLGPGGPEPRALELERGRKEHGEWDQPAGGRPSVRDISWQYLQSPVYDGRVTWLAAPGVAEPLRELLEAEVPGTGWRVFTWGTPAGTGGRAVVRRTAGS